VAEIQQNIRNVTLVYKIRLVKIQHSWIITQYMNIKNLIIVALMLPLFGCATQQNIDPLESMNRSIYGFNVAVDDAVMKPVAKGYKAVMPDPVEKGINNFFNNIRDIITVINDVLQLKIEHAANDTGRVLVNSTVGLLGLIDVHSMSGGERRKEDFGQTLAHYGWSNSAYLVVPLLGPSTIRDASGFIIDTVFLDPIAYIDNVRVRNQVRILQFIDARAELLNASAILDQAALDPYSFQRDAYLQYRDKLINDGDVDAIDYNSSAENAFEPYDEDEKPTDVTDVTDDLILGHLDIPTVE
jgi:phospholipid-binding lipoprotein MlaA